MLEIKFLEEVQSNFGRIFLCFLHKFENRTNRILMGKGNEMYVIIVIFYNKTEINSIKSWKILKKIVFQLIFTLQDLIYSDLTSMKLNRMSFHTLQRLVGFLGLIFQYHGTVPAT